MDACEATKIVMSRIKELDPENASKIVGHILLQGQGEKEVIRLAFAPESLLKSYINQAKAFLGIEMVNSGKPTKGSSSRPISYAEVVNGGVLESQSSTSPNGGNGNGNESLIFPYSDDFNTGVSQSFHRSDFELGWQPCMNFSRGECKNCDNGSGEVFEMESQGVDSSGFNEFLRMKAPFMASGSPHHAPYNYANFQDANQRGDLLSVGLPAHTISSSQQIYLTFPPDSMFKEEDVASYFSMFGPVQGVRIPYQQKRMFGFVTFVNPETVKIILAKGNPHFIRDARVLVKPYKEKGRILDRKQFHQQMERGDYYSGVSSSGCDSIEHLDIPFGPRMVNAQEKMLRRKFEEQADLRNAIEFQSQRMMNMQLLDWQDQNHDSDSPSSFLASVSTGSPKWTDFLMRVNSIPRSETISYEPSRDFDDSIPNAADFSSNS